MPVGEHTFYYPTGAKAKEGEYEGGVKSGDWKYYGSDGILFLTIRYKNGVEYKINGVKVEQSKSNDAETQ
jgi:antitoxin component YwqK of YwqJK toxin-antitoxin module